MMGAIIVPCAEAPSAAAAGARHCCCTLRRLASMAACSPMSSGKVPVSDSDTLAVLLWVAESPISVSRPSGGLAAFSASKLAASASGGPLSAPALACGTCILVHRSILTLGLDGLW
jgi:hypothetical protein